MAEDIIVCENLVKIYKTKDIEVLALQGLEINIAEGELMAIIGNSGSGKSTFLNMIGGLDRPSAGKLFVDGKDLFKLSEAELVEYKRSTVGFVWQNNARNLLPYLTALQNIQLPMMISGGKQRKERALELMERDVSVYMLHTDNTEAMAFDAEDIRSFDGIFGVEASEWETVKDRLTPPDYEKAFLSNPADSFIIYQLRDNDNTAQLRFMNAEYLEKKGLSIEKENYAAVYAGNLDRRGDTQDRLDELYETFNLRRPEDFRGHSLSVSDIVALKQNGVVSCHYVDSRGFKALPDFLKPENYLKNAEMAMEDDYGMIDGVINNGRRGEELQTVAELEEQAKSGKPVSLMKLAQAARREQAQAARQETKPSVLAKLCPPVNEPKKTARSKRAERELL